MSANLYQELARIHVAGRIDEIREELSKFAAAFPDLLPGGVLRLNGAPKIGRPRKDEDALSAKARQFMRTADRLADAHEERQQQKVKKSKAKRQNVQKRPFDPTGQRLVLSELAEAVGLSYTAVKNHVKEGKLTISGTNERGWVYIDRAEAERYAAACGVVLAERVPAA